jgi:uracil phosphoribosyltransferase
MALKEFTDRKSVQLLATQCRRTDIESLELCRLHFEMGKLLAYEILEEFELKETTIQHVQGLKKGYILKEAGNIYVVAMPRAGLFAAQGIRSVFDGSRFVFFNEKGWKKLIFKGKTVIIADAVINSGKTIENAIQFFMKQKTRRIIVATLVMQKEAMSLAKKHGRINFYAARISKNKYTGKGSTDTGNRLFNTL